jgi:pimeloyl-ACP methyl ester carboxylesterase
LAGLGLREIVDHYAGIILTLPHPPILIGHSIGGLIVQLLLDRGLGRAGVAIDSATPKGVYSLPWSVLRSGWPVLKNPLNYGRTVALTFEQFRYAFSNVMPEDEARVAYERYAVPGPGRPLFQIATGNFNPWAQNRINYRTADRAPLLLIGGGEDHVVPAKLNRINFRLYRHSNALTDYKEFSHRSHLIIAERGWREVAEFALTWLQETSPRPHRPIATGPVRLLTS